MYIMACGGREVSGGDRDLLRAVGRYCQRHVRRKKTKDHCAAGPGVGGERLLGGHVSAGRWALMQPPVWLLGTLATHARGKVLIEAIGASAALVLPLAYGLCMAFGS